jgi:ELP3 family radical SAM enzyme/protein acetyltransferase
VNIKIDIVISYYYLHTISLIINMEIESIVSDIMEPKMVEENKLKMLVKDLIKMHGGVEMVPETKNIDRTIGTLRNKYKTNVSKNQMRYIYEKFYKETPLNPVLSKFMIKRATRSRSGVLVSTIVLKPDAFSCPKKCAYCPTETDLEGNPTQPKSYLSSEPAMLRALQYKFDVLGQLHDRIRSYIYTGNISSLDSNISYKLEIIVSGGTWESYNYNYREKVMNEIYYAANTFGKDREMKSLEDEIEENENSQFRIIGLTIETRPDFITRQSIKDYRRWGVTRVQIGVQHYDDMILDFIKRECYTVDTIRAIRMLKETGFKVVCHLMPDLPGSSPEKDKSMLLRAIVDPDVQFDDVKIYPTAICMSDNPNIIVTSDIATWYKEGSYIPYAEKNLKDLINVLKLYKTHVQPWVRIQRLVRDIPSKSIEAGYDKQSNLRQVIQDEMKSEGLRCNCIRCLEIGDTEDYEKINPYIVVREYEASGGKEFFISLETFEKGFDFGYCIYKVVNFFHSLFGQKAYWCGNMKTRKSIIGFCRLRIDKNPGGGYIDELKNCALIREVHVYGSSLGIITNMNKQHNTGSQHKGYGQLLVRTAEDIVVQASHKTKVAIIAGVGTRNYYKNKCGYQLDGTYMVRSIKGELRNAYYQGKINIIRSITFLLFILFCLFVVSRF